MFTERRRRVGVPSPRRRRILLSAAAALAVLLAAGTFWVRQRSAPRKPDPIPVGDYSYTIADAEYRIRRLMKRDHLPSVAVALIDDQRVVWQEAFGLANVEEGVPATVDTVYKLWSVAKVFTAIETMRLVDEGLVDLDAPITDYVPGFGIRSRFPDAEPITPRSILGHRSGLPRNGCTRVAYRPASREVLRELAASTQHCYLAYPVGSRYHYSNIGPDLLGYIIQEQRGMAFSSIMEEEVLAPLGMASTVFASADIPADRDIALGYEVYRGDTYPYPQEDVAGLPSGNLYSTIRDMGAFVQAVFGGGSAGGAQVIDPATLERMFEEQFSRSTDPQPMGLGWKTARVFGSELLVWHDGGPSEGTGSLVALLPERKLGVVLFANEISFDGSVSTSLATEILQRMLETKVGVIPPVEETPDPVRVDRGQLAGYEGRYIAFGEAMDVFLRGDRLKGRIDGMTFDLVPTAPTQFRISHWLLKLGLADLLRLPIDLGKLSIAFVAGDDAGEDVMIIDIGGISYEICPRYPEVPTVPALWEELAGEYDMLPRLPSGEIGTDVVGHSEIRIEDGILRMSGVAGPLEPISATEIIILGGPFAGETIVYEPTTGRLTHQSFVFVPSKTTDP